MKRYIKSINDIYANEPIMAMATINPQLCKTKSIRLEVVQGGEGSNPHIHVYWNDGHVSYVDLTEPKYADHHDDENTKLGKKQKKEFIEIMKSIWTKYAIELYKLDEHGNRTAETHYVPATGYEAAVQIWCDTYGGEERFKFDLSGRPIMPNYDLL